MVIHYHRTVIYYYMVAAVGYEKTTSEVARTISKGNGVKWEENSILISSRISV